MEYADAEGLRFAYLSCLMIPFYTWNVENTWLISLIWTFSCRQMKGTQISNMRSHGKHSGLRTDETHYVWVAAEMGCNGTRHSAIEQFFHGIRNLQNM
jgi:hypothetical protein